MTVDLGAIKARLAAATPGPWETGVATDGSGDMAILAEVHGRTCILAEVYSAVDEFGPDSRRCVENARAIAHAPDDIAALLAEVERLRALLREGQRVWGPLRVMGFAPDAREIATDAARLMNDIDAALRREP